MTIAVIERTHSRGKGRPKGNRLTRYAFTGWVGGFTPWVLSTNGLRGSGVPDAGKITRIANRAAFTESRFDFCSPSLNLRLHLIHGNSKSDVGIPHTRHVPRALRASNEPRKTVVAATSYDSMLGSLIQNNRVVLGVSGIGSHTT